MKPLSADMNLMPLRLVPIPAFTDNYFWCLDNGLDAIVVDPGDATPVLAWLKSQRLNLVAIFITHHHADHVGGLHELVAAVQARGKIKSLPVYGPAFENIDGVNHPLAEADLVKIEALNITFKVMEVPGHTSGHIAYFGQLIMQLESQPKSQLTTTDRTVTVQTKDGEVLHAERAWPILFCGDTLFAVGCGRLFEGSPSQMYDSLSKLASLPDDSLVCCAHEYTMANIKFALAVDGNNLALKQRALSDASKRDIGLPTVPSMMVTERETNPFMRCNEAALKQSAINFCGVKSQRLPTDIVETFAAIRAWKNEYR